MAIIELVDRPEKVEKVATSAKETGKKGGFFDRFRRKKKDEAAEEAEGQE